MTADSDAFNFVVGQFGTEERRIPGVFESPVRLQVWLVLSFQCCRSCRGPDRGYFVIGAHVNSPSNGSFLVSVSAAEGESNSGKSNHGRISNPGVGSSVMSR